MQTPIHVIGMLLAAMLSSTAAAGDRTRHGQPAVSGWRQLQTTMGVFLEPGKRSLPPTSDVLRDFFGAALDRGINLPAHSKGSARFSSTGSPGGKTACMCAHYLGSAGSNKSTYSISMPRGCVRYYVLPISLLPASVRQLYVT